MHSTVGISAVHGGEDVKFSGSDIAASMSAIRRRPEYKRAAVYHINP